MSTAIVTPEVQQQELERDVTSLSARAKSLIVCDDASCAIAASILTGEVKALIRQAHEIFDPVVKSAYAAHQSAVGARSKVIAPLEQVENVLKMSIARYQREQAERREAEERRIRAEQAERERKAREEAEARRLEEERRLNEEIAARHANEIESKVEYLEAAGAAPEQIAQVCATPAPAPISIPEEIPVFDAPLPPAPVVKPAGITTPERWKAEVVSTRDLCRAIADGKVSDNLVLPNMVALNSIARAMKQGINVPGVRAVREFGVTAREARR